MSHLFPISQKVALISTLLFVFSYVLMGGTYAHAYTNTLQGLMMLFISAFLFLHGLKYFNGGFFNPYSRYQQIGPLVYNKSSALYYDFSQFSGSFIITFALMLQTAYPHQSTLFKIRQGHKKFLMTTFFYCWWHFGLILLWVLC